MKSVRNQVISEIAAASGTLTAAQISEAIRAFYDIRLKYLLENPSAVHQFDAEEIARAEARTEAAAQ